MDRVISYLTNEIPLCYFFTMPMRKAAKRLVPLLATATALAVAAAAAAHTTGTTLSFVAYSTPKPVMAKIIQGCPTASVPTPACHSAREPLRA